MQNEEEDQLVNHPDWTPPDHPLEPLFLHAIKHNADPAVLGAVETEIRAVSMLPHSRERLLSALDDRRKAVDEDRRKALEHQESAAEKIADVEVPEPIVPTLEEVTAAGYSAEQARSIVENSSKVREAWRAGQKTRTELEAFAQTLPWPKVP